MTVVILKSFQLSIGDLMVANAVLLATGSNSNCISILLSYHWLKDRSIYQISCPTLISTTGNWSSVQAFKQGPEIVEMWWKPHCIFYAYMTKIRFNLLVRIPKQELGVTATYECWVWIINFNNVTGLIYIICRHIWKNTKSLETLHLHTNIFYIAF